MKKILSVILLLSLLLSLAACGNTQTEGTTENGTVSSSDKSDSKTDPPKAEKALIVYFSASGNTKNAANYIAKATSSDTFEISPKQPYTDDDLNWQNSDSRVNVEHEDESKRNIELKKSVPDNWEEYDTVFIGYPIWWGIAAWPVDTFIKANDFAGKTVIPFCTSTSSELGESGELLKQSAGTGSWLEGKRFSSSISENDVNDWLNSFEY